jgi:hypothetical protein
VNLRTAQALIGGLGITATVLPANGSTITSNSHVPIFSFTNISSVFQGRLLLLQWQVHYSRGSGNNETKTWWRVQGQGQNARTLGEFTGLDSGITTPEAVGATDSDFLFYFLPAGTTSLTLEVRNGATGNWNFVNTTSLLTVCNLRIAA